MSANLNKSNNTTRQPRDKNDGNVRDTEDNQRPKLKILKVKSPSRIILCVFLGHGRKVPGLDMLLIFSPNYHDFRHKQINQL